MPRKLRELRRDVRHAGWELHRQSGSHERWAHPLVPWQITLAGHDGADAQHYQERDVQDALRAAREARRNRP